MSMVAVDIVTSAHTIASRRGPEDLPWQIEQKAALIASVMLELTSEAMALAEATHDSPEAFEETARAIPVLELWSRFGEEFLAVSREVLDSDMAERPLAAYLQVLNRGYQQALFFRNPEARTHPPVPRTKDDLSRFHVITDDDIAALRDG